MLRTGAALIPALLAATYCFGQGVLVNLAVTMSAGVAMEAGWVWARFRKFDAVKDASTPVTCALIAIAVPPALDPGILIFAAATAVILAKQLYGGIGKNVFNPAMVGYAAALVAFPAHFSGWEADWGRTHRGHGAGCLQLPWGCHRSRGMVATRFRLDRRARL